MASPNVNQITLKQQDAIIAMMREPSLPKVADAVGVGLRTIYRWLGEPLFAVAYREARRQAFGQAISQTQHYAPLAVNTLVRLMAAEATPAHVRVTAAATLLQFGRKGIELEDLDARIAALEQAGKANEPGQPPAPPPPNPWGTDDGTDDTGEPPAQAPGVAA